MPLSAIIMVATIAPVATLTASQERVLERALVCPEQLRDDAARLRNIDRFNRLYAGFAPSARAGERMAMRDMLLARKKCAPDAGHRQYSFPEE